jgi:hypothetical protein
MLKLGHFGIYINTKDKGGIKGNLFTVFQETCNNFMVPLT